MLSYGLNKDTHTQARHYSLYMEDNNSEHLYSANPRESLHSTVYRMCKRACVCVCIDLKGYLKVYILGLR